MEKSTLVSICIPTRNRIGLLKKVIKSIVNDNVDYSLFEIVISDNSDDNQTENYCKEMKKLGVNVTYYKNENMGFYNSITSLSLGRGKFLKLHNNYSTFVSGQFKELVEWVEKNKVEKPMLFFTNGELGLKPNKIITINNRNLFLNKATYLITWSSGFSIWRDNFEELDTSEGQVNEMFPHTSLLLKSLPKSYVINDDIVIQNLKVDKKGGYNIFKCFCLDFLHMIRNDINLDKRTKLKIKYDLYYRFIIVWYYRTIIDNRNEFTFDTENAFNYIRQAYGLPLSIVVVLIGKIRIALKWLCNV
ncbi:glycosyltransferase family 2 protein [Vibrio sp. TH_r3]|uniref:glycosyltransferase family 2 protein n=1 Tax=Vibrio sp. TH_r3 TaxID=3082084 RepID=UPI0029539D4F|nr:glycosyltransferase family 2 protein [Vibrio sp. TH_r3]MDV7105998.1 glycosyltransferase family 2 protein [Vibrio sp. TH_r3]